MEKRGVIGPKELLGSVKYRVRQILPHQRTAREKMHNTPPAKMCRNVARTVAVVKIVDSQRKTETMLVVAFAVLVLVVFFFSFGKSPPVTGNVAQDAVQINRCGYDRWENGKTYVLTQDLVLSAGMRCISLLDKEDITLDCNGHSITQDPRATFNQPPAGMFLKGHRLTVKNCRIANFVNEAIILQANQSTIEHNTIENNQKGINNRQVLVSSVTIQNNLIQNNNRTGIFLEGLGLVFRGNRIQNQGGSGLRYGTDRDGSVIEQNIVCNNNQNNVRDGADFVCGSGSNVPISGQGNYFGTVQRCFLSNAPGWPTEADYRSCDQAPPLGADVGAPVMPVTSRPPFILTGLGDPYPVRFPLVYAANSLPQLSLPFVAGFPDQGPPALQPCKDQYHLSKKDANFCQFEVRAGNFKTIGRYVISKFSSVVNNVGVIEVDVTKIPNSGRGEVGFHILASTKTSSDRAAWNWKKYCVMPADQDRFTCRVNFVQGIDVGQIMVARSNSGASLPAPFVSDVRIIASPPAEQPQQQPPQNQQQAQPQEGRACLNDAECGAGLRCLARVCQTRVCSETDGGNDPPIAGILTLNDSVTEDTVVKDTCENEGSILEYFCTPDGGSSRTTVACPRGSACQTNAEGVGACVAQPAQEQQDQEQPPAEEAGADQPPRKAEGEACESTPECAGGLRCLSRVCQTQVCRDSEGAAGVKDVRVPGSITLDRSVSENDLVHKDGCLVNDPNRISEYFCEDESHSGYETLPCPADTTCQVNVEGLGACVAPEPAVVLGAHNAGCRAEEPLCDGSFVCVEGFCRIRGGDRHDELPPPEPSPGEPPLVCTDTDGSNDPTRAGEIQIGGLVLPDFCRDEATLVEGVCVPAGNDYQDLEVRCPNGCRDGACSEAPAGPPVHFENEGCGPGVNAVCAPNLICRKKDPSKQVLQCLPPSPQDGFCEDADDCGEGLQCEAPRCIPVPPPPAELSENDICGGNIPTPCGQGLICRKENLVSQTLQCLPLSGQGGFCENTAGCTEGLRCQAGHCLPPPAGGLRSPCSEDADCGADNLFCNDDSVCDSSTCTDTDEANDPAVAGIATLNNEVAPDIIQKDTCVNPNQTNEWLCLSPEGGLSSRHADCPADTTCKLNADRVAVCQGSAPVEHGPDEGAIRKLIIARDNAYNISELRLVKDQSVQLVFVNEGVSQHTFTIGRFAVDLFAESSARNTTLFTPDSVGEFEGVCAFHPEMRIPVIVEESVPGEPPLVCTDTDGNNSTRVGEIQIGGLVLPDFCRDEATLVEGVCVPAGNDYQDLEVRCPNGCRDGVCVPEGDPRQCRTPADEQAHGGDCNNCVAMPELMRYLNEWYQQDPEQRQLAIVMQVVQGYYDSFADPLCMIR